MTLFGHTGFIHVANLESKGLRGLVLGLALCVDELWFRCRAMNKEPEIAPHSSLGG
jgi:hypothetical protein